MPISFTPTHHKYDYGPAKNSLKRGNEGQKARLDLARKVLYLDGGSNSKITAHVKGTSNVLY